MVMAQVEERKKKSVCRKRDYQRGEDGFGDGGKGDAPISSSCWFYRIRSAQSLVLSPDGALQDVIILNTDFGLASLLFQYIVLLCLSTY